MTGLAGNRGEEPRGAPLDGEEIFHPHEGFVGLATLGGSAFRNNLPGTLGVLRQSFRPAESLPVPPVARPQRLRCFFAALCLCHINLFQPSHLAPPHFTADHSSSFPCARAKNTCPDRQPIFHGVKGLVGNLWRSPRQSRVGTLHTF